MNRALLAKGYTFNPADGLFRKVVEFVSKLRGQERVEGRETLVRDRAGRLVRVERAPGRAGRFLFCAQ